MAIEIEAAAHRCAAAIGRVGALPRSQRVLGKLVQLKEELDWCQANPGVPGRGLLASLMVRDPVVAAILRSDLAA